MDILQSPRFQRVLFESASYQMLREVYRVDPNLGPNSVTLLRKYFALIGARYALLLIADAPLSAINRDKPIDHRRPRSGRLF